MSTSYKPSGQGHDKPLDQGQCLILYTVRRLDAEKVHIELHNVQARYGEPSLSTFLCDDLRHIQDILFVHSGPVHVTSGIGRCIGAHIQIQAYVHIRRCDMIINKHGQCLIVFSQKTLSGEKCEEASRIRAELAEAREEASRVPDLEQATLALRAELSTDERDEALARLGRRRAGELRAEIKEITARLRALHRRVISSAATDEPPSPEVILDAGPPHPLVLSTARGTVRRGEDDVHLTLTEYGLLCELACRLSKRLVRSG